jgi:hypothetical protein
MPNPDHLEEVLDDLVAEVGFRMLDGPPNRPRTGDQARD